MKIRDRIKSLRRVKASDLLPHPQNWRVHPEKQQNAMLGILADVGIAGAVIARELPNGDLQLIDGHLRADLLPDTKIPVLVLDVTEEEANMLLAVYDPIAAMAEVDQQQLNMLLSDIESQSKAVNDLIESLTKIDSDEEPRDLEMESTFSVVVHCSDEMQQKTVYEEMMERDFECKLLNL